MEDKIINLGPIIALYTKIMYSRPLFDYELSAIKVNQQDLMKLKSSELFAELARMMKDVNFKFVLI